MPRSFGKRKQLYLAVVIFQVCAIERPLPIKNVCLFSDGWGALKNIMRRLPALLPELLEMCVCGGGHDVVES